MGVALPAASTAAGHVRTTSAQPSGMRMRRSVAAGGGVVVVVVFPRVPSGAMDGTFAGMRRAFNRALASLRCACVASIPALVTTQLGETREQRRCVRRRAHRGDAAVAGAG